MTVNNVLPESVESCASISDEYGNLKYYAMANEVYDENHNLMSSIQGDQSTSQYIMIRKENDYYLVHGDNYGGAFFYSDLSNNNFNNLLNTAISEKVDATSHQNGDDIWVVMHRWNSNDFHSYLIDSTGFNTTPVVSTTGPYHGGSDGNAVGWMQFNEAGDKLAVVTYEENRIELYNFNSSTGDVSHIQTFSDVCIFNGSSDYGRPYGLEWHEDYILYSCYLDKSIQRINTTNGNRKEVGPTDETPGAIKRAPNGTIYFASSYSNWLGCIENPGGMDPSVINECLSISGYSRMGLPNSYSRYSSLLPLKIESFDGRCVNQKTLLKWQTTLEDKVAEIQVEFSNNGEYFKKIHSANPKGDGVYTVALNQTNGYYRLKIVDKDGKYKYSDIINIDNCKSSENVEYYDILGRTATPNNAIVMKVDNEIYKIAALTIK